MKRLVDETPEDALDQRAKALLGQVEVADVSYARMARVRAGVEAALQRKPTGLRRLSTTGLLVLLGLGGASAFAAVRVFVAPREAAPEHLVPAVSEPLKVVAKRMRVLEDQASEGQSERALRVHPQGSQHVVRPDARVQGQAREYGVGEDTAARGVLAKGATGQARSATEAPGARSSDARRRQDTRRAGDREPSERTRANTPSTQASELRSSALVHAAMRALRRDHDPAKAAALLDTHRTEIEQGPLAEEALALRVEAAFAMDDPKRTALVADYLRRYPAGRYVDKVKGFRSTP